MAKAKTKKKQKQKHSAQLLSVWKLTKNTYKTLRNEWKVFGGLILLQIAVSYFVLNSSSQTGQSSGVGTQILNVIFVMGYIYISRSSQKGSQATIRSALYRGPSQIVPFILLSLLAIAQLIPFAIGAFVFQIGVANGVAIFLWEKLLFGLIWFILALPSLYWLSTTLLSLVIVAIPDVLPLQAWRAAKNLVRPFLSKVLWRLLAISILILVLASGLLFILLLSNNTQIVSIISQLVFAFMLPIFWVYLFEVYKDLLKYE